MTLTREQADAILVSPCASYWLKQAFRDLAQRDPVDAVKDAETLAAIMRTRTEEEK